MKILALFAKLLDALAILLVYMAGRRDARQPVSEDARRAKAVENRLAGDASYADRVRQLFTRK